MCHVNVEWNDDWQWLNVHFCRWKYGVDHYVIIINHYDVRTADWPVSMCNIILPGKSLPAPSIKWQANLFITSLASPAATIHRCTRCVCEERRSAVIDIYIGYQRVFFPPYEQSHSAERQICRNPEESLRKIASLHSTRTSHFRKCISCKKTI